MKRFAFVVAIVIALEIALAALVVLTRPLSKNLYVVGALVLVATIGLYAAVLVVMRIRRRQG